MEKRSQYSFITTILNIGFGALVFLAMFIEFFMLWGVGKAFEISGDAISEAGNHELTGGYEVLGGLAIGFLGALGALALVGIIIASVTNLLMILATIIVGLVSRSNYKKNKPVNFIADSVVKIVVDGLLASFLLSSVSKGQPFWILFAIVPIAVVVLCVISLCTKIE